MFNERSKAVLLLWIICVIYLLCLSCFTSVHRCLVVYLLALDVMFNCVFVTVPRGILGQMWYWIVSIPDHCRLPYFTQYETTKTGFLATMSISV